MQKIYRGGGSEIKNFATEKVVDEQLEKMTDKDFKEYIFGIPTFKVYVLLEMCDKVNKGELRLSYSKLEELRARLASIAGNIDNEAKFITQKMEQVLKESFIQEKEGE